MGVDEEQFRPGDLFIGGIDRDERAQAGAEDREGGDDAAHVAPKEGPVLPEEVVEGEPLDGGPDADIQGGHRDQDERDPDEVPEPSPPTAETAEMQDDELEEQKEREARG